MANRDVTTAERKITSTGRYPVQSATAGLLLLWFTGISLRLTILAVPPLLPVIHHQLRLNETEVGLLTSLPVFLLSLVAVPGALLIARIGARRAVLVGMSVVAIGGALRPLGASAPTLFLATLLMGAGVAVCQPALPSLVREWLPTRIGIATAVFSNGMLVGEIVPVAITTSVLAPALGGWQVALAAWSLPVAAVIISYFLFSSEEAQFRPDAPVLWWPDWHDRKVWGLGLTLGGASAAYWGANAFVPELLRQAHHANFVTAALTSLNIAQLPASFIIAARPGRLLARRAPLVAVGVLATATAVAMPFLPPVGLVIDAGALGFSTAWIFVLTLALPPLLADLGDTHRLSAAMFSISYICPFVGSIVAGGLWDLTGVPSTAVLTLTLGGALIIAAPFVLRLTEAQIRLTAALQPTPVTV